MDIRGEPDELLGESGGVLPAENMEGIAFPEVAFGLLVDPDTFKEIPALALLSKDLTCIQIRNSVNGFHLHYAT